jgi:hypothetical protein
MEKILNYAFRSIALRLIAAGMIVILPVGLSTAWLGAAYQQVMWDADFTQIVLRLMLSGTPAVVLVGLALQYPLERWVIRERATRSWGWLLGRILLYTLAGVPIGLALLWSIRLGVRSYPAIIESSYFVITVTNIGVVGVVYSFLERALAEIQRREAQLKAQIEQLSIEIDEVKRTRKVQEITETDYFRDLQAKARQMRKEQ